MTDDQITIIMAISAVNLGLNLSVAYAVMNFAAMAADQIGGANRELTILQEEFVYLIALRYKRQIPGAVTARAQQLLDIIKPLADDERATRRREADDKAATRAAMRRAKDREAHQTALQLRPKGLNL